jgi:HSP20 family protein
MTTAMSPRRPQARRNWLQPFSMLQEELGELTSRVLGEANEFWPRGAMVPSLDLTETDSTVEVKMDVPGAKAEEIDIQVTDNFLTVSGTRKEEKEEKGKTYHRVERHQGTFSRTVTLPCAVDEAKVDAQYKNGVLTIKMPKTEAAKASKIKVHA